MINENKRFNFELLSSWEKPLTLTVTLLTLFGMAFGGYQYMYAKKHAHDLNGEWKLTFYIESSTLKRYIGKSSGNKIMIHTNDESFDAKGERWWVDDVAIPFSQHDRIEFTGTIKEEELNATYTLYGQQRTSSGSIKMHLIDENHLEGTFTGTAADTKGKAVLEKLQSEI